jgi:hypothetical protein
MKKMIVSLMMLLSGAWLIGCDDRAAQTKQDVAPAEALPVGLIVNSAADKAREVADVRKAAADGDEVVVRGRIGGSEHPFVQKRAAFQLVDLALDTCDKAGPMDGCKTPWDYCCDTSQNILANSITVQVVDSGGNQPLRADLNGVGGMKPMSEVWVTGKVKKSDDGKVVMVNATRIYVKQS